MRARRSSRWAFALLVPCALACGDDASGAALTAYDVHLSADGCTLAAADTIVVTVFDEAGTPVDEITAQLDGTPPEAMFPTGVRIAAGSESSAGFRIVSEMRASGVPINRVSARGEYVPGELEELRLLFDDACLGIECREGRTCVEGGCADDFMPAPASPHGMRATCPPIVYVDSVDGEDADTCGAIDAPCASIERAAVLRSRSGNGALINVRGDRTYTNDAMDLVNIAEAQSGSPRAPLVIRAWPGTGRPRIDGRGTSQKIIDVSATHVVLQGLEVTGATEHGITINGAENRFITIRDVVGHGNGIGPSTFDNRAAINVNNDATDLVFEDCELRDNHSSVTGEATSGIHINRGIRVIARNNRITGNDQGIRVSGSADVLLEGNTLVQNGAEAIDAGDDTDVVGNRACGHDTAIRLRPGPAAVRVEGNSVADAAAAAIDLIERPGAIVRANIVAFSGIGILVTADVDDSHNLYFGNETDFSGGSPSLPDTDVFADPLFVDRASCDLDVMEGSPALGAGPTGGPIGAL